MRIVHHIVARHDSRFWRKIDSLGLDYEHGDPNNVLGWAFSVLDIGEDQPEWPKVERLAAKYDLGPISFRTVFTEDEVDAAEWLEMGASGQHGYPQPEDDFGFIEATFDVSDYCHICGIGGLQNAPFRLRAEPKAAHSQFLQLNWVFDEFFVRREAREGLMTEGLTGFGFRPVVLHKTDEPSVQVEQMQILSVLPPALDRAGLTAVTCKPQNEEWRPGMQPGHAERRGDPYCGRVKYHLKYRGPLRFEHTALAGAPDVVKTHEWFGSGGQAFRLVLVSQRFRQAVLKAKWRGLYFEPVELNESPT